MKLRRKSKRLPKPLQNITSVNQPIHIPESKWEGNPFNPANNPNWRKEMNKDADIKWEFPNTAKPQLPLRPKPSWHGKGLKLAGDGLVLPGGGVKLTGSGWKQNLGGTLMGLAALGAAGGQTAEHLLGGAVLGGLGAALIAAERRNLKKKQKGGKLVNDFDSFIYDIISPKTGKTTLEDIGKWVIKNNKPVYIEKIFGKENVGKAQQLLTEAILRGQKGNGWWNKMTKGVSNIGKDITKFLNADKNVGKVAKFVSGKQKLKPSDLYSLGSNAMNIGSLASMLIPGAAILAPALKAGSVALDVAGNVDNLKNKRKQSSSVAGLTSTGLKAASVGANMIPGAQVAAPLLSNAGTVANIVKSLLAMKGKGMHGGKMPPNDLVQPFISWVQQNPNLTKTKFGIALGLSGATLTAAYKLYKKYGKRKRGEGWVDDSKELPVGVTKLPNGRIKRDRYSVYHGFYRKTKGGLTKNDFFLKKNKVVSKAASRNAKKKYKKS